MDQAAGRVHDVVGTGGEERRHREHDKRPDAAPGDEKLGDLISGGKAGADVVGGVRPGYSKDLHQSASFFTHVAPPLTI